MPNASIRTSIVVTRTETRENEMTVDIKGPAALTIAWATKTGGIELLGSVGWGARAVHTFGGTETAVAALGHRVATRDHSHKFTRTMTPIPESCGRYTFGTTCGCNGWVTTAADIAELHSAECKHLMGREGYLR